MAEPGSIVSSWRQHRFLLLLFCIVAGFILLPFLARFRFVLLVVQILLLNGILVAISANRRGSILRWLLLGGCAGNVVLQVVSLRLPAMVLPQIADAVGALVLGLCVVGILTYIFRSADITTETIFAAIVAYMFLALAFSRAYVIMAAVSPSSFSLREGVNADLELLYFSFVTIATLGYGDVTPRTPSAQMLAVLEAVIGQFYVAVLIAWLVSVYAGRRGRR